MPDEIEELEELRASNHKILDRICAACGQEWWTDIDYTKFGL